MPLMRVPSTASRLSCPTTRGPLIQATGVHSQFDVKQRTCRAEVEKRLKGVFLGPFLSTNQPLYGLCNGKLKTRIGPHAIHSRGRKRGGGHSKTPASQNKAQRERRGRVAK